MINRTVVALLQRKEFWIGVAGLLAFGLLLWFLNKPFVYLLEQAGGIRALILRFGLLAPLVYIILFALQVLIAPFPGQFWAVMSGYLFGAFWGSLYTIAGMMIGAGLAMWIGRRFGRPFIERYFDPTVVRQWERKLRIRSAATWGVIFLFPVPDLVFYVAGMSRVPLRQLIPAVFFARSLTLFLMNVLGYLSDWLPPEWVLLKWLLVVVAMLTIYRYQRQIRLLVLLTIRRWRRIVRRYRWKPLAYGRG